MSSLRFSRKIAMRYLWSKRSEAFITIITIIAVLGVAIGVIVLNMTMAIMSGFEDELRKKIVGNTHVQVLRVGGVIRDWREVSKKVLEVPDVKTVSPFTQHQALLSMGGRARGLIIRGVEKDSVAAEELAGYLEAGFDIETLFSSQKIDVFLSNGKKEVAELPALIIGRELAKTLSIFAGEPVSLLSPQVSSSPFGLVPRFKRFAVSGVYKSGMAGYEETLVYVGLETAQKFFRIGDTVTGLDVAVNNIDLAPETAQRINEALSTLPGGGYYTQDWKNRNKELWEALQLEETVYFIVLLLLIVLASFTIISALIMIVIEKRKDIAVLRTLGATTSSVANIFRMQGAIIGAVGTVLGTVGGYLGAVLLREYGFQLPEGVFPTTTVPVRLEFFNFAVVAVSAFLICCVSTIYPAWRASRLSPSEVLRYE